MSQWLERLRAAKAAHVLTAQQDDVVRLVSQATCTHQEHFPPTVTDGPTRQCRHCPHVWQVPCACGAACWTPTTHWGADGAGTVRWTCTGCRRRYGEGIPRGSDTATASVVQKG